MQFLRLPTFFLSLSLFATLGCSVGGGSTATTPLRATPDIYVAGMIETNAGVPVATYWKNGTAVQLGDGVHASQAFSIAVSGSDIYLAGAENLAGHSVATYWKNGSAVRLSDGRYDASVQNIVVVNGDVYVCGSEIGFDSTGSTFFVSEYWKNGVATAISANGAVTTVTGMFVSGNDVYVGGSVTQTTRTSPTSTYTGPVATIWKNGVPTTLTDSLFLSSVTSIQVVGSDVYAAGYVAQTAQQTDTKATYWKNGVAVTLPTGSVATSIFADGSDVYVAGRVDSSGFAVPTYWKNGSPVTLIGSSVSQITVLDGKVYLAGNNFPTSGIGPGATGTAHPQATGNWLGATYWANNYPVPLAPAAFTSSARAIAVVQP